MLEEYGPFRIECVVLHVDENRRRKKKYKEGVCGGDVCGGGEGKKEMSDAFKRKNRRSTAHGGKEPNDHRVGGSRPHFA